MPMLTKRFGSLWSSNRRGGVCAAVAVVAVLAIVFLARTAQGQNNLAPPPKFRDSPLYSFTLDTVNLANENDRLVYYLVRFSNDQSPREYEVIGSIAPCRPPSFCASDALLYVEIDSTCDHLIVVPMETPEVHDTVLSLCYSTIYWLPSRRWYRFRRLDSTLAFMESSPDPTITTRVLICKVKPGRSCDTIAVIEGAEAPVMSDDGTEVFLDTETLFYNEDSTSMDSVHYSVFLYDLLIDSLIQPFPSEWDIVTVWRPDRTSPLFYTRVDSNGLGSDVWMLKDGCHLQITRLGHDEYAGEFYIEGDSLICQAYRGWPRRYRRVAVGLD